MNCHWCVGQPHTVLSDFDPKLEPEMAKCECGCHQVVELKEFDRATWWLPAREPTFGVALRVRENPYPGLILENHYREPRVLVLGTPGPWVQGDEIQLETSQVQMLKDLLQGGLI